MNIRKVSVDDFDEILELQLQLEDTEIVFDDNLKKHFYDTEKGRKRLKKRISDKNNIFFVATTDDNKIVGFIDGNIPEDEWWYIDEVVYLDHICVDSNYRKQGIGTMLLNEFVKAAKEKGAKHIRLLAFHNNKPAVSFYKGNSFVEYSMYYNKKLF